MSFSKYAKAWFKTKGLTNRGISEIMDGYSETLISRYLKSDDISPAFVLKLKKYFPEAPVDEWLKIDNVQEPVIVYEIDPVKRINRIINELEEIKKLLKTQKD